MFYMIVNNEIQGLFLPMVHKTTNIPVPILTFHILWRKSKLYYLRSTKDFLPFPLRSVQFFKNFTFNVCKPTTHLAYLLELKQLGGQSFLSCMKTKIKCIGYFKCKVKMLGKGWGQGLKE